MGQLVENQACDCDLQGLATSLRSLVDPALTGGMEAVDLVVKHCKIERVRSR